MSATGSLVSVVIPAYNAAATLNRALKSVLRQTRPAAEILVIDDGGTDDLTPLQDRFSNRVRWYRQENQGAASARNRGIDLAKNDLVAFLDADDYWQPQKLEIQLRCFDQHPQLGLLCSNYFERRPGEPSQRVERRIGSRPRRDTLCRLAGREAFDAACCVWTGTVIAPRRLLAEHRFQSGLEPAEDRDLWFRLLQAAPSYFCSEPLATAVLEPNSLSRTQIERDCQNMLRVIQRARSAIGPRAVRYWQARTYQRWAAEYLGQGRGTAAFRPALRRLRLQPWSLQAWWIAAKSGALAAQDQVRVTAPPWHLLPGSAAARGSGGSR